METFSYVKNYKHGNSVKLGGCIWQVYS